MAVFTPLYLDQAFDAGSGNYLYSGKNFPRQSISGLEFYHGVSVATDSLNSLNLPLDIYIYDSKSARESLEQQFSKCAADGVELVIANCSAAELAKLARLGADKKIMVINANVPNDGNAKNNPYFVVLNSTLQTQVEGLYDHLVKYYTGKPINLITRNQSSEKYIRSMFETLNKYHKNALHLNIKEVNDDVALNALGYAPPVTVANQPLPTAVYIVGSLDTEFGDKVLTRLASVNKDYSKLTIIGMPTWENINLSKTAYKGPEIVYSTPFYNARSDAASRQIQTYYSKKMYARPSDLVFRGYAFTYRFGRLLSRYGKDLVRHLDSKEYRTLFDFDIKPAYSENKLAYYENKKLYFVKYQNGAVTSVK
ncbi:hypothetical protein GCM10027051_20750 [Niabella terrae]